MKLADNLDLLELATLHQRLAATPLAAHADALLTAITQHCQNLQHGDLPRWLAAVQSLPELGKTEIVLGETVRIIPDEAPDPVAEQQLLDALRALCPWRKGPYQIAGIHIDTEWRSDWKWQRLADALAPLAGRTVLDVGCGSGYHLWRMRDAGAAFVLGIDPSLLFLMQFGALQRYIQDPQVNFLPLPLEALCPLPACFDTVFSMGVIYHRRDPAAHLQQLFSVLRPGGELVMESLIIDAPDCQSLKPGERYARMRNVWEIPSIAELGRQLVAAGFDNVRTVSDNITSVEEQRTTNWMPFESLAQSLQPNEASRTVEGYPAPRRAVLLANRP